MYFNKHAHPNYTSVYKAYCLSSVPRVPRWVREDCPWKAGWVWPWQKASWHQFKLLSLYLIIPSSVTFHSSNLVNYNVVEHKGISGLLWLLSLRLHLLVLGSKPATVVDACWVTLGQSVSTYPSLPDRIVVLGKNKEKREEAHCKSHKYSSAADKYMLLWDVDV